MLLQLLIKLFISFGGWLLQENHTFSYGFDPNNFGIIHRKLYYLSHAFHRNRISFERHHLLNESLGRLSFLG
jgi:hypothetical protein